MGFGTLGGLSTSPNKGLKSEDFDLPIATRLCISFPYEIHPFSVFHIFALDDLIGLDFFSSFEMSKFHHLERKDEFLCPDNDPRDDLNVGLTNLGAQDTLQAFQSDKIQPSSMNFVAFSPSTEQTLQEQQQRPLDLQGLTNLTPSSDKVNQFGASNPNQAQAQNVAWQSDQFNAASTPELSQGTFGSQNVNYLPDSSSSSAQYKPVEFEKTNESGSIYQPVNYLGGSSIDSGRSLGLQQSSSEIDLI
ncbi:hypothetical protein G9A89_020475 [Geosiphon pyriformis]|nr:hypothetical protein G9A89_020475 [Geosiphon pyriformis]